MTRGVSIMFLRCSSKLEKKEASNEFLNLQDVLSQCCDSRVFYGIYIESRCNSHQHALKNEYRFIFRTLYHHFPSIFHYEKKKANVCVAASLCLLMFVLMCPHISPLNSHHVNPNKSVDFKLLSLKIFILF